MVVDLWVIDGISPLFLLDVDRCTVDLLYTGRTGKLCWLLVSGIVGGDGAR